MALFEITGRAKKCGPSAISAITGLPTHDAATIIRSVTGKRAVNGVSPRNLCASLKKCGWKAIGGIRHSKFNFDSEEYEHSEDYDFDQVRQYERSFTPVKDLQFAKMTLGKFLDMKPEGTWVIIAANHYVVYADGQISDSGYWFSRKPTDWDLGNPDCKAQARRQVKEAIRYGFEG